MLLKLLAAAVVLLVSCSETSDLGQSEQERGHGNSGFNPSAFTVSILSVHVNRLLCGE